MKTLILDGESLTLEKAISALNHAMRLSIASESKKRIQRARSVIESALQDKRAVYGITTGFGVLSNVPISRADGKRLQKNILMSHAAGVGKPLPDDIVRLTLLLILNSKAKGYSGIRLSTVQSLLKLYQGRVIPQVPEKGSVGASGDLAPLAHLSLVLIGKGRAKFNGKWMSGSLALKKAGLQAIELAEGEGLGLINGTQVMNAIACWTLYEAQRLAKWIDISACMSLEVLLGTNTQFDEKIHALRPHPGQIRSAANMRKITAGSEIISSHKDCERIQDAYSLRCSPQVHGASRDVFDQVKSVVEREMNSATENPLIFPDGDIMSGGNFHGQPLALAMDSLGIALAELGNISERRIERMVNPQLSGLPSFLIENGGLNSGFMITQYTAAALVSENKVLAHPASVDSIPTSGNKEDHVSMGTIAARKAKEILENLKHVVAIELLCATQALDLFTNLKPGRGTLAAYRGIRRHIKHLKEDREMAPDIATMVKVMNDDSLLKNVERAAGKLE